jgi:ring-1,2-phenylacetyl-CoA epoxidase subunit PaaC
MNHQEALIRYCIRIGDTSLILGQRLAELCGHGPILEEDIALTNISLDLIGQTRAFYGHACALEDKGRTEDDLAYLRDERDFQNVLLAEQPNGDFGQTILRQFLISTFQSLFYTALKKSSDATLSALAEKSLKEVNYHVRHSADWVIRLGQGTDESHRRMMNALDELWMYTDDLFDMDAVDTAVAQQGTGVDLSSLRSDWDARVKTVLLDAGMTLPDKTYSVRGSRQGQHTEHLGHLLAEMQVVHRSHPGATW